MKKKRKYRIGEVLATVTPEESKAMKEEMRAEQAMQHIWDGFLKANKLLRENHLKDKEALWDVLKNKYKLPKEEDGVRTLALNHYTNEIIVRDL